MDVDKCWLCVCVPWWWSEGFTLMDENHSFSLNTGGFFFIYERDGNILLMFVFTENYISVDWPSLFIQWAVVKNHTGGYRVWISMSTVHSSRSDSALRINVTWQWFTTMPGFILTFWLFDQGSVWVEELGGLLWIQRVLGHCFGIFWVLGYLWSLRVAGILRVEWQRRVGWELRVDVTLLLPRHTCALRTIFSQVSDRNLNIGERVGVPMARWADFLEVICGVEDTRGKQWTIENTFAYSPKCCHFAYRKTFIHNTVKLQNQRAGRPMTCAALGEPSPSGGIWKHKGTIKQTQPRGRSHDTDWSLSCLGLWVKG